jgi:hypothetical protein
MAVSGMSWNKANPDLLAAGYTGDADGSPAAGGAAQPPAAAEWAASGAGGAACSGAGTGGGAATGSGGGGGGSGAGGAATAGGGAAASAAGAAGRTRADAAKGLVALWSVRNLTAPRLLIETASGGCMRRKLEYGSFASVPQPPASLP